MEYFIMKSISKILAVLFVHFDFLDMLYLKLFSLKLRRKESSCTQKAMFLCTASYVPRYL